MAGVLSLLFRARAGAAVRSTAICLVSVLALTASSPAPETEQVNLADAIATALGSSFALKREEAKLKAAAGRVQEAAGAFDWTPMAETGWERLYLPQGVNGVLTTRTNTVDAWKSTVGMAHRFRNGIEMEPGISVYRNTGVSAGQSLGLTKTLPSLRLKIPLLQGLGEESANAEEQAARTGWAGSRLHRDFIMQRVVHDTVQAFWRCLAAADQQKIAEEANREASAYEAWLRLMTERGQVEPVNEQRIAADQATRQAGLRRGAEAVEGCRRELALVSGAPEDAVPVPVGELPSPDRIGPAIERLKEEPLVVVALRQRLDLRALSQFVEAEADRLRAAHDELLPKLDLFVDPSRVYLRYSDSINKDRAHGRVTKAEAAESEARINLEELRARVRVDVAETLRALRLTWANWKTWSEAERKIAASVATREKQAKAGLVGREQTVAAQDQLAQIRHERLEARLKLASTITTLRLALGMVELEGRAPGAIAADFQVLPAP